MLSSRKGDGSVRRILGPWRLFQTLYSKIRNRKSTKVGGKLNESGGSIPAEAKLIAKVFSPNTYTLACHGYNNFQTGSNELFIDARSFRFFLVSYIVLMLAPIFAGAK